MNIRLRCPWRNPTLEKDKGYAWLILVMSFLSHFVHFGFSFSVMGNLTVAHQKFFGIDLQLSSLMGSVHTGVLFIFGPLASVLVKKFGCRATQLFGGTCTILGVGLSSLSSEPWHAFLLFSILTAVGSSSCYAASSSILAYHFEKYRYFAFPAAMMGYYVGLVVWPITSQYLLDTYGYSKAMGIMSALHTLHIVAGVCFFESDTNLTSEDKENTDVKISNLEEIQEDDNKGCNNLALDVSELELNGETVIGPTEDDKEPAALQITLKQDFKMLLTSAKVWAFIMNGFLWSSNSTAFLVLVNDFILKRTDLSADEVALGITINGATNIAGCFALIFAGSLKFDRLILHSCSVMIFAVSTVFIAFSNGKAMYYTLAAIFGVGHGVAISNHLGVIHDFCGSRQLPVLLGLHMMAEGLGPITILPLLGYIATVSSEQMGIILSGCAGIGSCLCVLPVIVSNIRGRRKCQPAE